jgi:hypothetical protein
LRHLARIEIVVPVQLHDPLGVSLKAAVGEPLHVFEGSPIDICRALTGRGMRLRQEVDIGSSAEVALAARLMQLSAHEKNRCVLRYESVGSVVAIR